MKEKKTVIFFRPELPETIELDKNETGHLRSLRIHNTDKTLEFRDGRGLACFYNCPADSKKATLIKKEQHLPQKHVCRIATAIPKGNRLDWMLQKGTELGISEFVFVNFDRSERKEANFERFERIVQEAAAQCRRYFLPEFSFYDSLDDLWKERKEILILTPEAPPLQAGLLTSHTAVIGPEGGLSDRELELCKSRSIPTAGIGKNILRIETAVLFTASVAYYSSI